MLFESFYTQNTDEHPSTNRPQRCPNQRTEPNAGSTDDRQFGTEGGRAAPSENAEKGTEDGRKQRHPYDYRNNLDLHDSPKTIAVLHRGYVVDEEDGSHSCGKEAEDGANHRAERRRDG